MHLANAQQLRDAILVRERSASEVTREYLARADALNPSLGAFCELLFETASAAAHALDHSQGPWRELPLAGVPIAVKDGVTTIEGHTTFGSRAFRDNAPGIDAVMVARLRAAGCVVVGKTNMPELGMSATTDNTLYGFTRNPWNPERTPGGSSGGSAAAVAAGMAAAAVGTDGGGSIRVPASCCGLVGIKPTRARIPFAPSAREPFAGFAAAGPIARTVHDLAICFDVMAGPCTGDPYAAPPMPVSATDACSGEPERLRIGVAVAGHEAPVVSEIAAITRDLADNLDRMGHRVQEASPDLSGMRDAFLLISAVTFAATFPRGQEDQVEEFSRRLLAYGDEIPGWRYAKALEELRLRAADIAAFWDDFDLLLTPTLSEPPLPLEPAEDGLERLHRAWDWDQFCWPFNITGQPAITIPWEWSQEQLPVGVQLVAAYGREDILFNVAAALERERRWGDRVPPTLANLESSTAPPTRSPTAPASSAVVRRSAEGADGATL